MAYQGCGRVGSCHDGRHLWGGAQELLGKNENFWLRVSWIAILRPIQPLTAMLRASTQRPYLMQGELRQHHQLFWQNCDIMTQRDGQTLWQNQNARLQYLRDRVLSHAERKARQSVMLRFRQDDFSQHLVETSLSPWLLESDCYRQWRI